MHFLSSSAALVISHRKTAFSRACARGHQHTSISGGRDGRDEIGHLVRCPELFRTFAGATKLDEDGMVLTIYSGAPPKVLIHIGPMLRHHRLFGEVGWRDIRGNLWDHDAEFGAKYQSEPPHNISSRHVRMPPMSKNI